MGKRERRREDRSKVKKKKMVMTAIKRTGRESGRCKKKKKKGINEIEFIQKEEVKKKVA